MRICVLALALAAGAALALTGPAFAQMRPLGQMDAMTGLGGVPSPNQYQYIPDDRSLSESYVKKVTALSYKIVETRAEDGGKLTPEHLSSLQHQLAQLKRQYHVVADFQVRAE